MTPPIHPRAPWCITLLLALMVAFSEGSAAEPHQADAEPVEGEWPWATRLSRPIALGISSKDRSLVDAELRLLAEDLGRRAFLAVEVASEEGYDPAVRRSERRRTSLIAFDRWDKAAESLARDAGVDVLFVVTSARARKGKKVKKKYVPIGKDKDDRKSTKIEVQSLLYKFSVEVWARGGLLETESKGDVDPWVRVSRIRREGEREHAPMFLSSDTKKVQWSLAGVVGEGLYGDLKTAQVKLTSSWPKGLHAGNLSDLYSKLDGAQKAEFWRRARVSSPVKAELPAEVLLNLGLDEWSRTLELPAAIEVRESAKAFVKSWISAARAGWQFKNPEWFSDLTESLWSQMRKEGKDPKDINGAEDLENEAIRVEELLENFRSRQPLGVSGRRLPNVVVVAPEGFDFGPYAKAAQDPSEFYRVARVYSKEDFAKLKGSKPRWLKTFKGLKVIRLGKKPKTLLNQSAKSMDPGPVMELLFQKATPQWPGKPD